MPAQETSLRGPYRADIDGLRAVAVLLVLFDHVGIPHFAGGFVGVDVFFVISGFLIGSLLLQEMDAGSFSIGRFYERRLRRILPALLVMLAVCSPLLWLLLLPRERMQFAQTEMEALFSVSNIFLSHGAGYFTPAIRSNLFLHTWSLGVEEQFYIVLPLLLFLLTRWARQHLRLILWSLTILLFALACYWTARAPIKAFYLSPLRAWELLLGVLPAAGAMPKLRQTWMRDSAAAAGLLLIVGAGVLYTDATVFPGWSALAPCVGAVLIILAGQSGESTIGHDLTFAPLRWIGLVSYSLYLWHWPIQVLQASENILVPDRYPAWAAKVVVIAASLMAAALSWRFVEQPFRTGVFRGSKLWLFSMTGVLFVAVSGFCVAVIRGDGRSLPHVQPTRSQQEYAAASATLTELPFGTCLVEPETFSKFSAATCLAADPQRAQVLLVGDSHAGTMYWGLKKVFPNLNISLFGVTRCAPTVTGRNDVCQRFSDAIYKEYLPKMHVATVVLVARWLDEDIGRMTETVAWLRQRGIRVLVVGPSIEYDASLVRLIDLSEREHDPALLGRHRKPETKELDERMRALAAGQWHVPYVSMYDELCKPEMVRGGLDADGCPVFAAPGVPMMADGDHLGPGGSVLLARAIQASGKLQ